MFRHNKSFFVVSNLIITFFSFFLIYKIRYSWFDFAGVEKRLIDVSVLLLIVLYSLVNSIFNIAFKIYEINKISSITESFFSSLFSSIFSIGLIGIFFYLTQTNFARFVFFLGFLINPFIISIYNKSAFLLINKLSDPVKILYFGNKANFILFEELITEYKKWFNMNLDKSLITDNNLILKKKLNSCDLLVIDTDQFFNKSQMQILNNFEINRGKIYSLVDIFGYFDQSLPAEIIQSNHFELFSSYKLESIYNILVKRIFDLFLSIIFISILMPVILIFTILIKLFSKGSVFYAQNRVTLNGRVFKIFKFRSMKSGIDYEIDFTKKNDKRITHIGRIMRKLRIDEIPQLINVIKGEMSLIGPRPERPELINEIIKKYPLFKKRLLIKPGITGWAQVKYTYVDKIEKMNKKLSYDLYYLNNISFIFDLKIILYTLETIIFRKGAV